MHARKMRFPKTYFIFAVVAMIIDFFTVVTSFVYICSLDRFMFTNLHSVLVRKPCLQDWRFCFWLDAHCWSLMVTTSMFSNIWANGEVSHLELGTLVDFDGFQSRPVIFLGGITAQWLVDDICGTQ